MSLPNIEISPILDIAWAVLQFAIDWTIVLSLLVFLAVLLAGAGDIFSENLKGWRGKDDGPVTRTKE